jgi:DNA-binding transcriptional LysR family regulator
LARGPLDAAHIAALPLLMLRARQNDWREWFAAAGYGGPVPAATAFEDLAVVFEFARQGLGVALAQRAYLDDELRSGALVLLSDIPLRRPMGYCALSTPEAAARPKVRAFLDWLATQAVPRTASAG